MFHRSISLPAPFHCLNVFALVEPVAETETEVRFAHRLYLINAHAEGGKVLLCQVEGKTVAKHLLTPEATPVQGGA